VTKQKLAKTKIRKTEMNKEEISNLKNNIAKKNAKPVVVKEKGFMDLYDLVVDKKIWPVYDQANNVIAINCLISNPTGLQYSKIVDGQMTVGKTEKEREADEKALKRFVQEYGTNRAKLLHWFCACLQLIEADIVPARVDEICGTLYYYLPAKRKVINERGDDVVKLDKSKRRLDEDTILEMLADKLALALEGVDPSEYNATPDNGDDEECCDEEDESDED